MPIRLHRFLRLALPVLVAGCCLSSGGCELFSDTPRSRLGALPFPGPYTLYTRADPDRLGRHRYGHLPRFFGKDERQRGIIYTTRAGFLDLAHLRMTIDWTRYYVRRTQRAIEAEKDHVVLAGMNKSKMHLHLHYPTWWTDLTPAQREATTRELALRIGQRLAHSAMSWHEMITWFGHRSVGIIDESPSSFTYDDTMSHVIGVRVADRALRDRTREYNAAVTAALDDELFWLGAVQPAQTDEAVAAVQGLWWANGQPLKRQIDIKPGEASIRPWLARGLSFCPDLEPKPFELPRLDDVLGRKASGFFSARIEPRIRIARWMRTLLPRQPRLFSRERHLPMLLDIIREAMRVEFGDGFDEPWPQHDQAEVANEPAAETLGS